MPSAPSDVFVTKPDGTTDFFDEGFYAIGGALYSTFDTYTLGADGVTVTLMDAPYLYRINPVTGIATVVAPTLPLISAIVSVGGTTYAFQSTPESQQVLALNLSSGATTFVSTVDPSAGPILERPPLRSQSHSGWRPLA